MKKVMRVIFVFLEVVLIAYVVLLTTFLLMKNKFGYVEVDGKTLITVNKKNQDTFSDFKKGDLVILESVTNVGYDNLKSGNIVYFYDTIDQKYVIKKDKLVEKTGDVHSYLVILNEKEKRTVNGSRVLGLYKGDVYSGIGGAIEILISKFGFLLLVILPIMLMFIYQIYKLIFMIKVEKVEIKKDPKEEIL